MKGEYLKMSMVKNIKDLIWGENYKTSLKFSFAGIGLMGCRVADVISQITKNEKQVYNTLGININEEDLGQQIHLQNKLLLQCGYSAGGRNPNIGYEAVSLNRDKIQKSLAELGKNSDFIWLVAGLGGGTGTGAILQLIEWAEQIKQFLNVGFGIIISVPQTTEKIENKNALKVLSVLNDFASRRAIPIIVVDNELLFQKYLNEKSINEEFTNHSNIEIANLLHRFNVITSSYIPYGSKHFDGQEFKYVLENGGCIQFSKTILTVFDFKDNLALKNKLQAHMQDGIASEGYDLKDATMAGVAVFVPSEDIAKAVFNVENIKILDNTVNEIMPNADVRWGGYINSECKDIEVYTIISGLSLPSRIEDIPNLIRENGVPSMAKKLQLDVVEEHVNNSKDMSFTNPFQQKPVITTENKKVNAPSWIYGNN